MSESQSLKSRAAMAAESHPGEAQFVELYSRQSAAMLVFFTRRTWDPEAAMDLTAETFAAAFAGRRSFRGESVEELDGWLFGIARHQLARFFRRGRTERSVVSRLGIQVPVVAVDDIARIEELAGLKQLRDEVAAQLARLPDEQRRALELRVVDGLSYERVATHLSVSEQTARKRVSRGLRRLSDALDPVLSSSEELS